jgi:hypothetical protein
MALFKKIPNFDFRPKYRKVTLGLKIKNRLKNELANRISNTWLQFRVYASYWHYKFNKCVNVENQNLHYLTQAPDIGAGIGHQLANWNCGFYFARKFGVKFAHSEFSSPMWDSFLGFGESEIKTIDLLLNRKFKKVHLPRFDCDNAEQVELVENIIKSYNGKRILFFMEINQGYKNQFETYLILKNKFFNSTARKFDILKFESDKLSIAIHIRRGDINVKTKNENLKMRWQDNTYFKKVLNDVLSVINKNKEYKIYLFSQGTQEDFPEFRDEVNLEFCLNMNTFDSFAQLCKADLLISSKSSFSYKPALISNGIKICPKNFWHNYPQTQDYILVDDLGNFDLNQLSNQLNLVK